MRAVAAVAVVLCGGLQAAAFSLPPAVSLTGLQPRIAAMAPSCGTLRAQSPRSARKMVMQAAEVDVKEYIKIFGRLGEKMLFGDASAGLCCHSACENCEWRYSFDVLQAARPKWIPTYRENKFEDGREHVAKWSTIFEEGDEAVTKEQFCERLAFYGLVGSLSIFLTREIKLSSAMASDACASVSPRLPRIGTEDEPWRKERESCLAMSIAIAMSERV